jgi:hypothetical protein
MGLSALPWVCLDVRFLLVHLELGDAVFDAPFSTSKDGKWVENGNKNR